MADWGDVGASFIGGFNAGSQFGNRRRALDLEEPKIQAETALKQQQLKEAQDAEQFGKLMSGMMAGDFSEATKYVNEKQLLGKDLQVQQVNYDPDYKVVYADLATPDG